MSRLLTGPLVAAIWRFDRLRALVWRFWPQGRLRAAVVTQLYQRVYDHMNRHDDVPPQLLHDDVVVNQTAGVLGVVGEYRGRHAPRELTAEIKRDFAELRWQPRRIVEVPGRAVVAHVDVSAVGRSSGIELTMPLTVTMPISRGRAERIDIVYGTVHP